MKKIEKENQKTPAPTENGYTEWSRRDFLANMSKAGLLFMLPLSGFADVFGNTLSQGGSGQDKKINFPVFTKSKIGDGIIGPYGEVRIRKVDGMAVPVYIAAADGSAFLDFTTNKWILKFGAATDISSITLTSAGIVYGKAKPLPYSKENILRFVENIKKDKKKIKGAMFLRASLLTSYMVALQKFGEKQHAAVNQTLQTMTTAMGIQGMDCSVQTIFGPVTTLVPGLENVWKTAEEQFDQCYSSQRHKSPCNSPITEANDLCAWGICAAKGFVDVLVDTIQVMVEVTQDVWHDVYVCTVNTLTAVAGSLPNPFTIAEGFFQNGFAQPLRELNKSEINKGIALLKEIENITGTIGGYLGPFAECALAGDWSIKQLDTKLNIGGKITIPYGIKVCISAECAKKLSLGGLTEEAAKAWGLALGILAVLQPSLGLGSVASAVLSPALITAITSAMAGAGEAAVIAGTIVLAWILIALYYSTVISAQLEWRKNFSPNDFKDGKICIEHPTFAIALVTLTSGGTNPAVLIPPIVTG